MAYGPLRTHFVTRKRIQIDEEKCVGCKLCMRHCPNKNVIGYSDANRKAYLADPLNCGGCSACLRGCPSNAIHITEERMHDMNYAIPKTIHAPGQSKS